jgi:hypothetical protein
VTKQQCVTVRKCVEEQVPADELGAGNCGGNGGNGGNGGCGKARKACGLGCKKGC